MNNKIANTVNIEIDGITIPCYILEDGKKMLDWKASQFFRVGLSQKTPKTTLLDKDNSPVDAYNIKDAVSSFSSNIVKKITIAYINDWIDRGGIIEEERALSEFDKLILKAMKYAPKENE
ncbi:hypothetical protein LJB95_01160 [Paludibacteraceae bacterium OttesenSCG-928-F17]|nr:hypothetical protein [Paludibacteraceae bacterium OttesenSCG-928-F17]